MSQPDTGPDEELDAAMAGVYRGPREEFVSRRDALAKELRSAGRADAAKAVKSLRKPTLQAWALDAAVQQDPSTVEGLAAAVVGILEAQDGRGELRPAMDRLQAATRQLASRAAQAAADGGHKVDQSAMGPVVLAVIGDAPALQHLRAGRLAEVPTAGGLDLLTGAAPPPDVVAGLQAAAAPSAGVAETEVDEATLGAARDQLDQAESTVEAARQRATTAEQAADGVATDLETAEKRLRQVEQEVRDKRAQAKQAKQEARTAANEARQAERAAAKARASLKRLSG